MNIEATRAETINNSCAVVIPCYRVSKHIVDLLTAIPECVARIYVVDDFCPEKSGALVEKVVNDPRIKLIYNTRNLGVGGAVMAGYMAALSDGMDVVVKIDGDGQMDPSLLPLFIAPILNGEADYTKGNRFYDLENIGNMPAIRVLGNAALSFMSKLSSGYWHVFDPTNGYTAIHVRVIEHMPMEKISNRYFFETDMLFRLNILRAVVVDIPMDAVYGNEESNLRIAKVLPEFLVKNMRNLVKRIFYNYFLRDMTLASIELVIGAILLLFGVMTGAINWVQAIADHKPTPLGTIMLAAMPVLVGLQLLLAFLGFDISNQPRRAVHMVLPKRKRNINENTE